ncbi:MAG: Smr/MutS family protein [Gammaproteobacteria bacterium]
MKLKRGQIRPQADLDLHGMTVEAAVKALARFVSDCRMQSTRCVRVIHGKGFGSPRGEARVRPAVASWLGSCPEVVAYCPAQPRDGGAGATYVLLKLEPG